MTRTEQNALPAEITHPGHPRHKLKLMVADAMFACNGCKQPGKGRSYRCEECDYDIHTRCAPTELSFKHSLLDNCKLDFLLEPPGPRRWCDACGDDVLGFMYYNRDRDIDLHPRCAFLPQRSDQQGVIYDLHTKKADAAHVCRKCEQKGSRRNNFWSYRSSVDGKPVYIHVGCIMDGSDSKAQSVPPTTTLVSNPGQSTWYKTAWKIAKTVMKLTLYVFTFDAMGAYTMFEELFNG